jgi:hypothetical protein
MRFVAAVRDVSTMVYTDTVMGRGLIDGGGGMCRNVPGQ